MSDNVLLITNIIYTVGIISAVFMILKNKPYIFKKEDTYGN